MIIFLKLLFKALFCPLHNPSTSPLHPLQSYCQHPTLELWARDGRPSIANQHTVHSGGVSSMRVRGCWYSQLSIKACPNTWLPKTLTSVQLQPNIAEHFPAMVTYSPSKHSPQCKSKRLFLFLVLNKLIRKLIIALSWNKKKFQFSLS